MHIVPYKSYENSSMNTPTDITSIAWIEESFEIKSYTDSNASTTDSQTKEKLPNFNKRKRIILATIIVIIIMIVIIMLATMIPLLALNKTIKETTGNGNVNYQIGLTSAPAITYDVGGGGASGGSPCSSYTVVNDPSRNVNGLGFGGTCDNGALFNTNIGGRWIRFMGTGGTKIPNTSLGTSHCGSYLAGWYNGTLPETAGTVVNETICFDSPAVTCIVVALASVANCDTYYVYFLPPLKVCNARYCTI